MRVDECDFPDSLLYDSEALTWARASDREVVIGITSIHAALAGKLMHVKAKPIGSEYERGKAIGTIEGSRYFGVIRTPVGGVLVAVNAAVLRWPKTLSNDPYGEGWFARLRPTRRDEDMRRMSPARDSQALFAKQIADLRVRCFAAVPDFEMWEIGTECAAVLVRLTELVARIDVGEVVHLVSDDPTAPIEMNRWTDETKQPVIETRREGSLYHFLVRKVA